jgi:hypothetical protein
MSSIRTWHTYIGLLIAPSVLFFCLTGSLQLFGLHEPHGAYVPPGVIEKLGRLHKDQLFAPSERHEQHPESEAAGGHDEHGAEEGDREEAPGAPQLLLKSYFLLVALGLMTSTLLGLWMGLTHVRHKHLGWSLLALGVMVPVALALL